jgi:hypothetical protein
VTGCGGDKTGTCVPGATQQCACTDGRTGAQTCDGSGTWDVCQCTGSHPSGGMDGGDPPAGGSKRVFITKLRYSSTLAKTACQTVADAASLGGTWIPWLSYANGTDASSAITGSGPWTLLSGDVIFSNHAQLGTAPAVPINVAEDKSKIESGEYVWTGTLLGGIHSSENCSQWGGDSSFATVGTVSTPDAWTDTSSISCGSTAHLYCFEQ